VVVQLLAEATVVASVPEAATEAVVVTEAVAVAEAEVVVVAPRTRRSGCLSPSWAVS